MLRKIIIPIILIILVLLGIGMKSSPAHSFRVNDNRYAVVVGVGHDVNSDNSARLMVSVLKDAGWSMKNIRLLTNRQATRQAIIENIDWLKSIENSKSLVVVAFFCHGSSTGVMVADGMFPHGWIRENLGDLESKKQLVIIASCQSGGAIVPGFDDITLIEDSRIVVTSCGEITVDPCTHRYTRWAERFLLQGIKEGLADADGNGMVSIQEARDYGHGKICDGYGNEFFLE